MQRLLFSLIPRQVYFITWLGVYESATPGVNCDNNPTVRLDGDNKPQPDTVLRLEQNGRSFISEDDYIEGSPELIVEVAASSASYSLHDKLRVYRGNLGEVLRVLGQGIGSPEHEEFMTSL